MPICSLDTFVSTAFVQSLFLASEGNEPLMFTARMALLWSKPYSSCGSSSHEMIPSCKISEVMTASMQVDPTDELNVGSLQRLSTL